MLLLTRAFAELSHQPGCAALFDGTDHLIDRISGANMSVGGTHVVDGVGKIRHGLGYGCVAVQLGCGAENGGQLRGIAE